MATPALHRKEAFYRPELDALRFFAFLAVFVTHTVPDRLDFYASHHVPHVAAVMLASIGASGVFGVSLFFMLSSYLITSLLLKEQQSRGTVDLKAFYVRRILRIWPLYFFALGLAALWPDPAYRMPANYLVAFLLLAGNWMTVLHGPAVTFGSILWSVSVEEQFYVTWPLLIKSVNRRRAMILVCVGLIVAANLVRVYLWTTHHMVGRVFENTLAQLDTIAFGALLAIVGMPRLNWPGRILLAAGSWTALVVCGWFYDATPNFVLFGFPAVCVASMGLLVAANGVPLRPTSYLVRLGKISYGLYVYHTLALLLAGMALHGRTGSLPRMALYVAGGFVMTVTLAEASYRWLETPFLRLKERYTLVASRPV